MYPQLANDYDNIVPLLQQTIDIASQYYARQRDLPPSLHIQAIPETHLPEVGIGAAGVLDLFKNEYAQKMANSAGPRYFGFVTGGSTPASVAGDWLVSVYDQVMSGNTDSVAHALERQTINFLLQLFKLGEQFKGTFVTGATMSNFVALATARQWLGEQLGVDASEEGVGNIPIRILSASPHSSIFKSMSMLGVGRKAWVKVPTLPDREAIDVVQLEQQLKTYEQPVIVVANAGTVNTVDFDDLEAIASLKKKYNFWLHVDAAFGGFAAVSPTYEHYVRGMEKADTVTIDAHKWMNVPYDAAMIFTRHRDLQVKVFQNSAAYLGNPSGTPDSMHLTPENSRRFRALPAWFTLMAYGREGYREIVERNCQTAQTLGQLITNSTEFRLLSPVRMNVVCFTIEHDLSLDGIRHFLEEIRDDGQVFFTQTLYQGIPAIRAAISNWQTKPDDIEYAFGVLKKIYLKTFPVRLSAN